MKRFVTDADYKREIRRLEKKAGGIRVMTGGQMSSESFDPIGGVQLKDQSSTYKTFLRQIGGDTYLTANAFFDGTTWRRVDTAKVSWALILRGSSNYPGGSSQSVELWTAPAGANPIGLFGTGSWVLLTRHVPDLASVITKLSVGEAPVNDTDVIRKAELDAHQSSGSAHGAVSEATAGAIIKRDNAGRAKVADPSDNADIATKKYVDDNAGASSFLSLSDTPSSYTGAGSKVVRVKSDESALEFVEAGAPGAHHTTHESGGSDAIKLDDLAAPDDNTDLDVSTSKHGLCPKAPNDTNKFLRGDGSWATVSGGGGSNDINFFKHKGTSDFAAYYTIPGHIVGKGSNTWTYGSANRLYAIPFVVSKEITIDTWYLYVTTAQTGSEVTLGIYQDNGNLSPAGASLVDVIGYVETKSTGIKSISKEITLSPGLYWLAHYASYSSAPVVRAIALGQVIHPLGYAEIDGNMNSYLYAAQTYSRGSMPSTYPSSPSVSTGQNFPLFWYRLKAS